MKKRSLHRLIALPLVAAALTWTAQASAAGCGSGSYLDNTQQAPSSNSGYQYNQGQNPQGQYQQGQYQQGQYQQGQYPQGQQGQYNPNYNPGYNQGSGYNPNSQGGYNQSTPTYSQTSSRDVNNNNNSNSGSFWDDNDGESDEALRGSGRGYSDRNSTDYDSSRTYNNGKANPNKSDNGYSNPRRDSFSSDESYNSSSNQAVPGSMMMQQGSGSVVDIIANNPQYSTLYKLLQANPDLISTLKGSGPFTIFAPTNAAFNKLSASKIQDLTKPENKDKLRKVLAYHVISGKYLTSDLKDDLKTVNGDSLDVEVDDNTVTVDGAKIVQPNIMASNGVIQGVDTVLMP